MNQISTNSLGGEDAVPSGADHHFPIPSSPETSAALIEVPPPPNFEERLGMLRQAGAAGHNVLLLASADLLRALAEVPTQLTAQQVEVWHQLLVDEVMALTRLCEQLNVRRDHMLAARYVLCTAMDEAAGLAPWSVDDQGAGMWANMALLPQFHGEREGGEVVFMLLGRMANAPQEHMPVLELIHHVLSLGYMGQYRTKPDGHRQLEGIRHRLFVMVTAGKEAVPRELSERWRGVAAGKFRLLRAVPVWASASVLGLVLLAQFGWFKYQLLTEAHAVEQRIHDLRRLQPTEVAPRALGLQELLQAEIALGVVTVDETAERSVVTFKGDGMFAPGQSKVGTETVAVVDKVGRAVAAVGGKVVVSGHTDNRPRPDPAGVNLALSLARAQAVSALLQAQGVASERLEVVGRADQEPVASNDTAAGRAQNRRVVIDVIPTTP